jgi:hypothetical protein
MCPCHLAPAGPAPGQARFHDFREVGLAGGELAFHCVEVRRAFAPVIEGRAQGQGVDRSVVIRLPDVLDHTGELLGPIEVTLHQRDCRGMGELLEVWPVHPFRRCLVPVVHLVAVTQLAVAPPELLAANAGEKLEPGSIAEVDEFVAARQSLVRVRRPDAEAVGEQRPAERHRVTELASCCDGGVDHLGAPFPGVAAKQLNAEERRDPDTPCLFTRRERPQRRFGQRPVLLVDTTEGRTGTRHRLHRANRLGEADRITASESGASRCSQHRQAVLVPQKTERGAETDRQREAGLVLGPGHEVEGGEGASVVRRRFAVVGGVGCDVAGPTGEVGGGGGVEAWPSETGVTGELGCHLPVVRPVAQSECECGVEPKAAAGGERCVAYGAVQVVSEGETARSGAWSDQTGRLGPLQCVEHVIDGAIKR